MGFIKLLAEVFRAPGYDTFIRTVSSFTKLRFGPLPERVLALYAKQILEGVAYLHLNRVIHRDLKGNNVMLMPTGIIKLIDFGCARRLGCVSHTTSDGADLLKSVHGTPYWMAPEVDEETCLIRPLHLRDWKLVLSAGYQ